MPVKPQIIWQWKCILPLPFCFVSRSTHTAICIACLTLKRDLTPLWLSQACDDSLHMLRVVDRMAAGVRVWWVVLGVCLGVVVVGLRVLDVDLLT